MGENTNEVGVLIKTKAEDANSSVAKLISNLENVSGKLDNISISLDKITNSSNKTGSSVRKTKNELNSMSAISSKLQTSFNKAFDVGKLYLYFNVTKQIRDSIKQLIGSSISYIETQNLFDVSMKEQSKNAYRFMNAMAETFGMARTQLMEYQASFNNVMKSLPGLADETSYLLSETLTKMSLDYSSIFNVDMAKSMEKFQAALVGTVKPIRDKTGLDITEKTLQSVATNIGVEKTVSSLNQVEKRLLRIIALQNQLGEIGAIGDLAKTLESPSNQLKVLNQQLQELGVWLGNVFIGTIGKVLPYINGFVMALVAMAKALAIFVGYTETKYDNDPLQLEDSSGYADDLSSSLGGATAKAKELKKQLMGFDVLNVITTPTESDSGGASGPSEIDPAILNALKEYDNLMGGVRMKAEDIRDKIMEWLGFEKLVDDETGEITWKLKEGWTNFEKIKVILITILSLLVATSILKKLIKLVKFIREVKMLLEAISGLKVLQNMKFAFDAVAGGAATAGEAIKLVLQPIIEFATKVIGIGLLIGGIVLAVKEFFDMLDEGFNANKEALMLLGIALAAIGAIILGAPAVVAAIVAAIVAVVATIIVVVKENWEKIKSVLDKVKTWIDEKFIQPIAKFFKDLWEKIKTDLAPLIEEIKGTFEIIGDILKIAWDRIVDMFSKAWDKIKAIWDVVSPYFKAIWEAIKIIFSVVGDVLGGFFKVAWTTIKAVWDVVVKYFTLVWAGIKAVFAVVKGILSGDFSQAWEAIKNVWDKAKGFFSSVWEGIKSVFGSVGNFFKTVFEGAWTAIKAVLNVIITGFETMINVGIVRPLNSVIRGLNNVVNTVGSVIGLEIGIPQFGQVSIPRLATGGLPDVGQMFIAREAGPELVGNIGGRNAVMNNDQIVQSVSQGVAQAVASVLGTQGGNYNLYIDGQQITDVITRRKNRSLSVMGV